MVKLRSAGGALHATTLLAGVLLGAIPAFSAAAAADPLSELLKKQTEEFSQAGQKGDRVIFEKYLDPGVVFTNEAGDIASRADLLEGMTPTPAGTSDRRIEVTNWSLHRQAANIATATFVDELTQHFDGQTLVLRFRSTETWMKRPSGWKMIVSHTSNVVTDPAAIALTDAQLDDYVGVYRLAENYSVKISRGPEGLVASSNGGAPIALKVEMRDVLFVPGVPNARRLFQRDAAGKVTGYISRRDGTDLVLAKVAQQG